MRTPSVQLLRCVLGDYNYIVVEFPPDMPIL